jgi:DNA-binding response OmpR family regulator
MPRRRILLVEDDAKTRSMVELYLAREGYEVVSCADGEAALDAVAQHQPHLLVLDLMLPRLDGLEVARRLRAERDVPIIMVTARSTEDDKLTGLNVGADDYVTKPFSPRELMARIRAVLRRAAEEDVLVAGTLAIDRIRQEVRVDGETISLTPAEYRLLETMVRAPGRIFTRDELLDSSALDRTVDAHVMKLRKKLGEAGKAIVTVFGVGYKFVV